jgi:signal transduction histidine kinase
MKMEADKRRALLSWAAVVALLLLCAVLGVLQYTWIGEVSVAERERLRDTLQAGLNRLSGAFNAELATAGAALIPRGFPQAAIREEEYAARFKAWKESAAHEDLFQSFAIVRPDGARLRLRRLNEHTDGFEDFEWPPHWAGFRQRLESRIGREPREPGPDRPGLAWGEDGLLIEIPQFGPPPAGPPGGGFGRGEVAWLVLEVNLETVRGQVLPELLRRHLGADGTRDYAVEVVTRDSPPEIIYRTDPGHAAGPRQPADASVALFDVPIEHIFRRFEMRGGREAMRGRGPPPDRGRWLLSARHRTGSLETVVARTRVRNLAVMSGILLLIVASMAALIRFTRRAQRLAELQMDFVAGVSHELRTPLTVIRTAAYNLRGRLANNPAQVEGYGALIQRESERLTELVEQVLRFASAKAGHVVRPSEPVLLEGVIGDSLASCQGVIEAAHCTVEKRVDPDLPLVLGDAVALKQAVQNLLGNAAKYGAEPGRWIGVFAQSENDGEVSIRVADRGPGIPREEQDSIFDPFFRGRRAIEDQVHGTGLGLNLVKGIVEAHGGTITVNSAPGQGAEFTIRIPAAPAEYQDEFKNITGRG